MSLIVALTHVFWASSFPCGGCGMKDVIDNDITGFRHLASIKLLPSLCNQPHLFHDWVGFFLLSPAITVLKIVWRFLTRCTQIFICMINNVFAGVDGMYLLELMCQARKLKSLCLSGTQLADKALYNFSGSSLEMLDVSDTMVSYYMDCCL